MNKLARIRENRRDMTGDDLGYEQLILEQRAEISSRDSTIKRQGELLDEAREISKSISEMVTRGMLCQRSCKFPGQCNGCYVMDKLNRSIDLSNAIDAQQKEGK